MFNPLVLGVAQIESVCHNFISMTIPVTQTEVQVGPQWRLVIPAALRRQLGVKPGDVLVAHLEEGRLILEKPETIKQRLKARFAQLPKGRSLATELLAERRQETKRENNGEDGA